jgi:hypothetical protein
MQPKLGWAGLGGEGIGKRNDVNTRAQFRTQAGGGTLRAGTGWEGVRKAQLASGPCGHLRGEKLAEGNSVGLWTSAQGRVFVGIFGVIGWGSFQRSWVCFFRELFESLSAWGFQDHASGMNFNSNSWEYYCLSSLKGFFSIQGSGQDTDPSLLPLHCHGHSFLYWSLVSRGRSAQLHVVFE